MFYVRSDRDGTSELSSTGENLAKVEMKFEKRLSSETRG